MSARAAQRLSEFLRGQVGDDLRRIVEYDHDGYEVVYRHDDVIDRDDSAWEEIVQDAQLEAISTDYYGQLFPPDHGELECMVKYFENAVELNFARPNGSGIVISIDAEAMADTHGLVSEAKRIARGEE